jgi:trigger factor
MGSKRFFEEFENALEGAAEGEEKTCEVTFPETYSRPDLRGKVAKFVIKVKDIRRMSKPELDEEFAKKAGHDSIEALRARIVESLQSEMTQMVRGIMERKALDEIITASTFEFPKTMVRRATESALEERIREMHRAGATDESLNEMREKMAEVVEGDVMRDLRSLVVMNEISVVEGVEATDEDFEKHAEDMARRLNLDPKVVSTYISGGEQRNHYEEQILRGKALDVILNCAQVVEKAMTVEEFKKANGTEDQPAGE